MAEKNLDFDRIIDRRNTGCLKYDFESNKEIPEDALPLWVADMDFQVSSYIQEALKAQAEHGIYGYNDTGSGYFDALWSWFKKHHDFEIDPGWLVKTPGVVFALSMAVRAFTNVGDSVLIQQPVYYPFSGVVTNNKRVVVSNTLVCDQEGNYHMDLEDFEEKIIRNHIKLFLLCNPHNPVGRVWSKEELAAVGDICLRHHVAVVSDEIHADFVYQGKHHVFAGVKEAYKDISVVCTAPSKTFNIAGLQVSNILIPSPALRHPFKKQIEAAGYSQLNAAGIAACQAAYGHGEEWYQGALKYIEGNLDYMKEYIDAHIPEIRMNKPEGTYLAWLDFRELGLTNNQLEELVVKKAGLWLDAGAMFGDAGEGFQRVNAACPRKILEQALKRLEDAVKGL
ncbi:cystathionine beta-lyase PatB [Lachnospiraceae bacterium]|nr:cystathionine beta-lyase PatB [Lachnospiraceae bacterium]